jgi:hypothetical protein
MQRLAAALLVASLVAGCGYRLIRRDLPAGAGSCIHFEALGGGGSYPQVATWTSATLREEIAPDLCPHGASGDRLVGSVEAVGPVTSFQAVADGSPARVAGTWIARAGVRIERQGETVWGPVSVEVERDFVSTGTSLTEIDALDTHLRLISEDLARAVADVVYGLHPVVIEPGD